MKRINNCKIKELFPWIWDRFNNITLVEFSESIIRIKLDELYNIVFNKYVFQIYDITNRATLGTITTDLLLSLKPEIRDSFFKSLLHNKILTNRDRFNCICDFGSYTSLQNIKNQVKDEIKNFFYTRFKIKLSEYNELMVYIMLGQAGTLCIKLNFQGSVIYYDFESDNYAFDWCGIDGSEKLTQFYRLLNGLLSQEIDNEVQE